MKKKLILFLNACIMLISSIYAQMVTYGVPFDEAYKAGKDKMVLNGAGVRKKHHMDLYVAGLYVSHTSTDAGKIVNANEATAMKIVVTSSMITKSKMDETIREGFQKSTNGNIGPFQDRIDKFVNALSEDIGKGATYMVVYTPNDEMVRVYKDNQLKTEIKGLDFKKAVFGIWLGDSPVDNDLKNKLLKR